MAVMLLPVTTVENACNAATAAAAADGGAVDGGRGGERGFLCCPVIHYGPWQNGASQ